MLPTPDLTHLGEEDYEHVYEPAEDSFALLDALQNDRSMLRSLFACPLVVEIGSGTGIASSFMQSQIFDSSLQFATDINFRALKLTRETSEYNRNLSETYLDVVRTDLLSGLHLVSADIVLFNPPYVPTMTNEVDSSGSIRAAWAGGADGIDVVNRLLPQIAEILSQHGLFYLVTVARNKPEQLLANARSIGLAGHVVLTRKAGREKLTIIRFHRADLEEQLE